MGDYGWIPANPGFVDVSGLLAAREVLCSCQETGEALIRSVGDDVGLMGEAWSGPAFDAWAENAGRIGPAAEAIHAVEKALIDEIDKYLERLSRIRDSFSGAERLLRVVLASATTDGLDWVTVDSGASASFPGVPFAAARSPLDRFGESVKTTRSPWPVSIGAAQGFVIESVPSVEFFKTSPDAHGDPVRTQGSAEMLICRLRAALVVREEADWTFSNQFRRAIPQEWSAQREYYALNGVSTPEDMTAATMADLLARSVGSGKGLDLELLEDFLRKNATDIEVMERFHFALGLDGDAQLVNGLGWAIVSDKSDTDSALACATMVRSSLSRVSANWEPDEAREFAEQLVEGPNPRWAFGSSVGFLFGDCDGSPMGQNLTLAVADLIDDLERAGAGVTVHDRSSGGADRLSQALEEKAGKVVDPDRVRDPAGRVLQTLGVYPDAALEWVMDGAGGEDAQRVEYWFGQRDWSQVDHWEGPGALWAAIQRASGGPNDLGRYQESRWNDLQHANGQIFTAISANNSYTAKALNDRGAAMIASAVTGQLPSLSVYPVTKASADAHTGQTYRMFDGSERVLAPVDVQELNTILKAATLHAGGIQMFDAGLAAYREQLKTGMANGTINDKYAAVNAYFRFQAAIDGAALRERLDQAKLKDHTINKWISALGTTSSLIPEPFSKIPVTGFVIGPLQTQASELFADNYRTTLEEYKNNEKDLNRAIQREMNAYIQVLVDAGVSSDTSAPITDWSEDFLASYRDALGNNSGVLAK